MTTILKERLKRGDVCIGTFLLFLSGPDVIQLLAGIGFDYLIIDMEHSSLDFSRARETIAMARACNIAPIVRISEVSYSLITRTLDAGAEGILLPRTESEEQCRELVRCARFRPVGERGLTTFAGHNDFSPVQDVEAFVAERNRNVVLLVQIETRKGLENRDSILSESGIDGCLVGTGDLAFSLGYPGETGHPEVVRAAECIFDTCRRHELFYTLPIRTPDDTARWQSAGMNMVTLTTDGGMFMAGAQQFLASVDRSAKRVRE